MENLELKLEFRNVKKDLIYISPFQRKVSEQRVKQLQNSIETLGFLVPLVLTPIPDHTRLHLEIPEEKLYLLVDGQHRFEAGLRVGITDFPSVIVPNRVLNYPTYLNIEKSDNLRDISEKLYSFYLYAFNHSSSKTESEILIGFEPHHIPIAFSYKEFNLSSPSLIENFVKKTDIAVFYDLPIETAIEERRAEAQKLKLIEQTLQARASELGITDFFQKQMLLNKALKSLWGSQRGSRTLISIDQPFSEAVQNLIEQIGKEVLI